MTSLPDSNLFRPQELGNRMRTAGKGYNWHSHRHIEDPLARIYAHLHYLTSHAPLAVSVKWKQAHLRYWARTRYINAGINRKV